MDHFKRVPDHRASQLPVQQGQLTAEELIKAAAHQEPVLAGGGEVTAEVEEGLLADLASDGMGADQGMANIWVIVECPGLQVSDRRGYFERHRFCRLEVAHRLQSS